MPRAATPRPPREPRPTGTPTQDVTYPIRAVSLMTGVSIDTLRAWERRYGAVTPVRDGRGRMYTEADVRRITMLRDAVERGHAIGRVARLSDDLLSQVVARAALRAPQPASQPLQPVVRTESLIGALERFDAVAVETELARAASLLRAPDLLRDVLMPLLTELGDRWHSGRAAIAHEHMLSAAVRNVLGSLLHVHQKTGLRDQLLFATPAGERHEFGTLGAAVMAASGGLGTIYLGPDMPADDIVTVTRTVQVEVVVLGVTAAGDSERGAAEVARVAEALSPGVELWIGGPGAERAALALNGRAMALPSYDLLEQQLLRLGARF